VDDQSKAQNAFGCRLRPETASVNSLPAPLVETRSQDGCRKQSTQPADHESFHRIPVSLFPRYLLQGGHKRLCWLWRLHSAIQHCRRSNEAREKDFAKPLTTNSAESPP